MTIAIYQRTIGLHNGSRYGGGVRRAVVVPRPVNKSWGYSNRSAKIAMKKITQNVRIASIGDFCVDDYVESGQSFLGGSAFNFAVQAQRAGAQTSVLSAIGTDANGERFLAALQALHINATRLQQQEGSTSRVVVRLNADKSPRFEGSEPGVLADFELTDDDRAFLQTHAAARSILRHGLKRQFEQFCQFHLPGTLKAADFAGGSAHSVSIETISRYAPQLDIVMRSVEDEAELGALKQISRNHHCMVIGTLGSAGSIAFANGEQYTQAAPNVEAVDTTGAGDAYLAHFIAAYLRTNDIQEAMHGATQAAANSVLRKGAT
jgi:fructoselysine 6-kinase